MSEIVRRGQGADLPALTDLYNHYIVHTPITFDLEPYTSEQRAGWFAPFAASGRYQIFVAERDGRVIGYACSLRFRPKAAYDPSVETSVYLAPDAVGRGTGRRLLARLLDALASEDVHRAYAGITLPNPASLGLHRAFDYRDIAVMSEVGRKFDRYWDVAWLEKKLG
jgi:phosphinothricin acetyltransferase